MTAKVKQNIEEV